MNVTFLILRFFLFLTLFLQLSCSHFQDVHENNHSKLSTYEYAQFIKQNTLNDKGYVGFYNVAEAWITPMTESVQLTVFNRWADSIQITPSEFEERKQKFLSPYQEKVHIFLDFYTPDRKFNKLDMGSSIWKVHLKVGEKSYEGKIKKHSFSYPELKNLFYYHTTFTKPYEVSFPLSPKELYGQPYDIIITSARKSMVFSFNR